MYRKYFNVLSDPTIRIACAAKPEWDTVLNEDVSDVDLRAGIGPEILTANDRETAFVQNSTNSAERSKIMTPVSEASSTSSLTVPAYKPPVYIPPSHTQKKIQKPRKIRTWVEQVSKLGFGEHLDSEGEEYKQAIASLAALAGIAGFAGCEVIENKRWTYLMFHDTLMIGNLTNGNAYRRRGVQAARMPDSGLPRHVAGSRVCRAPSHLIRVLIVSLSIMQSSMSTLFGR